MLEIISVDSPKNPPKCKKDFGIHTLKIPESLPYFQGHFPDNPILPAVGIIDICHSFLDQLLERKTVMKELKKGKFSAPIKPNDQISIEVLQESDEKNWKINIYKENEKISFLQFSIV